MRWLWLLLLVGCIGGCSDDPVQQPDMTMVGGCDGMLTIEHIVNGSHVAMGSTIEWTSNPPDAGPHFPIWAAWDRQYAQLARGNYVHNAEHGGIVLLYNCPDGCPDVVASLVDVARNMAPDPMCTSPVTKRVILTGDPLLPAGVQVAAVAWNIAYTASCFDPYIATFARDRYAKGPENFCSDGASFGGTVLEP